VDSAAVISSYYTTFSCPSHLFSLPKPYFQTSSSPPRKKRKVEEGNENEEDEIIQQFKSKHFNTPN